MNGPAMSASCAMWSNARSSSHRATGSGRIDLDLLPAEVLGEPGDMGGGTNAIMGSPLREARETFEREYLRVQIRRFSGNISRTAHFIGMERSALHRKLKLLGITETREE